MRHPDRASEPEDLSFEIGHSNLSPLDSFRGKECDPQKGFTAAAQVEGANNDTGVSDVCIEEQGGKQMLQTRSALRNNVQYAMFSVGLGIPIEQQCY